MGNRKIAKVVYRANQKEEKKPEIIITPEEEKIRKVGNYFVSGNNSISIFACPACGEISQEEFINFSSYYMRTSGKLPYCKTCISEMFNNYMNKYMLDKKKSMINLCQKLDIAYNERVFELVENAEEKTEEDFPICYLKKYNMLKETLKIGETYDDGDDFLINGFIFKNEDIEKVFNEELDKIDYFEKELLEEAKSKVDREMNLSGYGEAEVQNKIDVIKLVGFDPFSDYDNESSKQMYSYMLDFLDDSPSMTPFIVNIYIQIVKQFEQINRIDKVLSEITSKEKDLLYSSSKIKELNESKTKIQSSINSMAKDNGISLNHSKEKGDVTKKLTYIMNTLNSFEDYDSDKVNMFDIKTSKAIEQIEKISQRNILNQISLDENDYLRSTTEQYQLIKSLEKQLTEQKEKNRKKAKRISKLEEMLTIARNARKSSKTYQENLEVPSDDTE